MYVSYNRFAAISPDSVVVVVVAKRISERKEEEKKNPEQILSVSNFGDDESDGNFQVRRRDGKKRGDGEARLRRKKKKK